MMKKRERAKYGITLPLLLGVVCLCAALVLGFALSAQKTVRAECTGEELTAFAHRVCVGPLANPDFEDFCGRLMLINHGRLGYDGSLAEFQARYGDPYRLYVTLQPGERPQHPHLQLLGAQEGRFTLGGSKAELPIGEAVSYLSTHYSVRDLRIEESSLESILKAMY